MIKKFNRPDTAEKMEKIEQLSEDFEKSRKEGTKIYYYFDPDMKTMNALIDALRLAIEITQGLPDRSGEA